MGDIVRIGLIGSGYWGPKLIRNFHEAPQAEVVYVADLDHSRLNKISSTFPSIQTTSDYRDLLIHGLIDAVVVATPVSTHFAIANEALQAGKHVMIEKPLANSVQKASELVNVARKHRLRLMVGHVFMYNPAVELLKELIASGDLGEILYVDAVRATLGLFQKEVNVIWDLAPHDFSILRFILGSDPISISARGESYIRPGIEDVAYITATYPRKVQAHIRVSWLEPRKQRHMTVVGSKKMVVYDDTKPVEKIKVFDMGVDFPDGDISGAGQLRYRYGDIVAPRINPIEPLQAECRHFLRSILEDFEPRSDGEDGLAIVRSLDAADQSLHSSGAVIDVIPSKGVTL